MSEHEKLAVVGVRLMGLLFLSVGLWMLVGNVVDAAGDFNPGYASYFVLSQLLRPLLLVVSGVALWWGSRRLGRLIARIR